MSGMILHGRLSLLAASIHPWPGMILHGRLSGRTRSSRVSGMILHGRLSGRTRPGAAECLV